MCLAKPQLMAEIKGLLPCFCRCLWIIEHLISISKRHHAWFNNHDEDLHGYNMFLSSVFYVDHLIWDDGSYTKCEYFSGTWTWLLGCESAPLYVRLNPGWFMAIICFIDIFSYNSLSLIFISCQCKKITSPTIYMQEFKSNYDWSNIWSLYMNLVHGLYWFSNDF